MKSCDWERSGQNQSITIFMQHCWVVPHCLRVLSSTYLSAHCFLSVWNYALTYQWHRKWFGIGCNYWYPLTHRIFSYSRRLSDQHTGWEYRKKADILILYYFICWKPIILLMLLCFPETSAYLRACTYGAWMPFYSTDKLHGTQWYY